MRGETARGRARNRNEPEQRHPRSTTHAVVGGGWHGRVAWFRRQHGVCCQLTLPLGPAGLARRMCAHVATADSFFWPASDPFLSAWISLRFRAMSASDFFFKAASCLATSSSTDFLSLSTLSPSSLLLLPDAVAASASCFLSVSASAAVVSAAPWRSLVVFCANSSSSVLSASARAS